MSNTQDKATVSFPAGDLRFALKHLQRPFAPDAIRFKPFQEIKRDNQVIGARIAAYLEVLTVVERLHLVAEDQWSSDYADVAGNVMCRLTLFGVTRSNAGEGNGKGVFSDALKRAALMFGVGHYLRQMDRPKLWIEPRNPRDLKLEAGRSGLYLPDATVASLREKYGRWLELHPELGEALDHGRDDPHADETPDFDPATGELRELTRVAEHLPDPSALEPQQRLAPTGTG